MTFAAFRRVLLCFALVAPSTYGAEGFHGPKKVDIADSKSLSDKEVIDHYLKRFWTANAIEPGAKADDYAWLRRAYLDMIGRIPTEKDIVEFKGNKDRGGVCEKLAERPEFSRRWAEVYAEALLPDSPRQERAIDELTDTLEKRFQAKDSWADIASDLVAGDNGFQRWHTTLGNNDPARNRLTEVSAQVLLGVRVQCANCHDQPDLRPSGQKAPPHPSKPGFITQEEYLALNAFFRKPISGGKVGAIVGQRRNGELFDTLPGFGDKGIDGKGRVTKGGEVVDSKERTPESAIGKMLTEHDMLPRAAFQRMWGQFFGRGTIDGGLDDHNPNANENHPALAQAMAERFKKSGYDIRSMAVAICKSQAYSLSSDPTPQMRADATRAAQLSKELDEAPDADKKKELDAVNEKLELYKTAFARGPMKRLTVSQLVESIMVVTGQDPKGTTTSDRFVDGDGFPRGGSSTNHRAAWRETLRRSGMEDNTSAPGQADTTVISALAMLNGERMNTAVKSAPVLAKDRSFDDKMRMVFLIATGKVPAGEKLAAIKASVTQGPGSDKEKLEDLLLTLMNTSDFVVNK